MYYKMIFEAIKLRNILDLIYHEWKSPVNLELTTNENYLTIAVNYGDLYYISYVINISNEVEVEPNFYVVLSNEALNKLNQMINLWPKSSIQIMKKMDHISINIVQYGQLLRERPVLVECVFQLAVNDYALSPPSMKYNCSVNSRNLKQMLEFCCDSSKGIILEVQDKSLNISNHNSTIATQVQREELVIKPSEKIKLSAEANSLVILFLNKIINRFNLVYLLFIEPENAFSIYVKLDDLSYVQIYTIHE